MYCIVESWRRALYGLVSRSWSISCVLCMLSHTIVHVIPARESPFVVLIGLMKTCRVFHSFRENLLINNKLNWLGENWRNS